MQVLDLGLNNLNSISRALRDAGTESVRIVASASDFRDSRLMVLPGVGAFGAAMTSLRNRGLEDQIHEHVQSGGYLMGICLGMHLLLDGSSESPGVPGLGLIRGSVHRIPDQAGMRVPHMGWTNLVSSPSPFKELQSADDFYFVHSFVAAPVNGSTIIARARYGSELLPAALLSERVVGFQFHPEKSSQPGARLLREVRAWSSA